MKRSRYHGWRRSRKTFIEYRILFVIILLSFFCSVKLVANNFRGDVLGPGSRDVLTGAHSRQLLELSLMAQFDGHGCGADSVMGVYGLPVWIVGIVFTFFGLALVCDDYFVDSLERISLALNLSDDVAGATFMAAGSSAPELFTSLVGVFFKDPADNPGPGTIVGSAVFNITVIIGVTTLLTKDALALDWWPLMRDSTYYSISILLLIIAFVGTSHSQIDWWEGLIMWVAYFGYILVMKYNERIINYIEKKFNKQIHKEHDELNKMTDGKEALPFRRFRGMNPRLRSFYKAGMEAVHKWKLEKCEEACEKRQSEIEQKQLKFKAAGKAIVLANRFSQVAQENAQEEEEEEEED
eukprot:737304_1